MRYHAVAILTIMVGLGFCLYMRCEAASPAAQAEPVSLLPQVEQIREKLKAVREYSCVVNCVTESPHGTVAYTEERLFRRPNLFYAKQTVTDHPIEQAIGGAMYRICTGEKLWTGTQDLRTKALHITYCDSQKMRAAGIVGEEALAEAGYLVNPFRVSRCERSTLRLQAEDDATITFSSEADASMSKTFREVRLTLCKADGVLRKLEYLSRDKKSDSVLTFSDVKINPDPPLDDGFFIFKPPAGTETRDTTEMMIQALRAQGLVQGSGAPAAAPTPPVF